MRRKPPVLIFAHALKDVPCAASETKAAARSFSGVNIDASSSLVFIDDMLWPCVARIESGDDDAWEGDFFAALQGNSELTSTLLNNEELLGALDEDAVLDIDFAEVQSFFASTPTVSSSKSLG